MANDRLSISIDAIDNASKTLGGIGNAAQAAGGKFNTLGDHVSRAAGNLAKIGAGVALGGILALGSGVVGLATSGLTLNNSMEKVSAQLNAFTKDSGKTADIIEIVRQRAAKTPFEFDAMAKAAVALFPASKTAQGGLEGILEKAEILAASNPAEGLEGAAFALKEAVSGDFTSIIERFNLPRQYINDLKKEGVPNLEIVQRAMKEMGLDVDLVSNLANTAEGRWSTFKDTLTNVAAQATKPIFEAMSGGIAQVNTYLEANGPLLNQIGTTIAGTLTTAIQGLTTYLPMVIAGFQQFGATITPLIMGAAASFNLIGAQVALAMIVIQPALDGILQAVTSIFGSLIPIALTAGMGAWTLISTTIQTAISSAIAIVQTWLPVVQTVLGNIALFLQTHGAQIQLLVSTAWATVTTIIQTAINTITVVINALAPVVDAIFSQISAFLNAHGSEILGTLTTAWQSISAIVSASAEIVQKVVTAVFGMVASFINAHGDTIQAVLSGAWRVISTVITETLNIIKSVVTTALAVINGDWATAWAGIKSITESSNNLIKTVIQTAMTLIESVITTSVANFKQGWEMGWQLMRQATDAAWEAIKLAINNAIEAAKTTISNGVEAFLGKFRDLRDKMSVIGQQLLEGMVQGIRDKVGWLVDEGVRAANAVLAAIKSTLGIKSPSVEGFETSAYLIEGLVDGITSNADDWVNAGVDAADRVVERIRVTIAPLPDIMAETMSAVSSAIEPPTQAATNTIISAWSGLTDDLENEILSAAESIWELAESGDTSSRVFVAAFDSLRQTIKSIVPSFDDSGNAISRLFESIKNGTSSAVDYWDIYFEMIHNIGRTTTQVMPVVAQTVTATMQNMGLSTRWFAESFEDQILMSAESFVELAQHGDTSSRVFVSAFENIKQTINQLVPSFSGGQGAMQAMHAAMANGQFDVEAYWKAYDQLLGEIKTTMGITEQTVATATQNISTTATANANTTRDGVNSAFDNILVVAGVAINTLTGEVLNSSNSMSGAMNALANSVTSATQTMQNQASSAAQSIAASMIAAGQVINTTQSQLANFIQSGGVGGITGGTYTPSKAFQDLFTNPQPVPAPAPPRPSSVPKPSVVNNTPINITITGGNADRYAVEDGVTTALRRAGMGGRYS